MNLVAGAAISELVREGVSENSPLAHPNHTLTREKDERMVPTPDHIKASLRDQFITFAFQGSDDEMMEILEQLHPKGVVRFCDLEAADRRLLFEGLNISEASRDRFWLSVERFGFHA